MKRSRKTLKRTRRLRRDRKKGGAKNDICGLCPICDSTETHRYATSPAGNIIYCECANGHIYSN